MGAPDKIPASLVSIQLPAVAPGKEVVNDPSTWVCATNMGDLGEVPGSWLQSGQVLAFVAIQGVNQRMKSLIMYLPVLATLIFNK